MIATSTILTESALTTYAYAPIIALFVYLVVILISKFRW